MRRNLKARVLTAGLIVSLTAAGTAAAASSPSVATGSARKVQQLSALLNGTINPNGARTTYVFQWGETTAYGAQSASHSLRADTHSDAVAAPAHPLIPGTVYHYRLVAFNQFGVTSGADRTFKTTGPPPASVQTGPATALGSTFATTTGTVNPNGGATSWTFQYGPTTAYGAQTSGGSLPPGSTAVPVSSPLQGLAPSTIFHYRLVAVHPHNIVSDGSDAVFMTFPTVRPRPSVRARTTPRHPRHKPFVLTTSGTVSPPGSIPAMFACPAGGDVAIRFLFHGRAIASHLVPVQPNCTFATQSVFRVRPGHGHHRPPAAVSVIVHFTGNGYLAPARARTERVVLG